MPRPLMQLGIMELESLFAKSRRDMQALRNLEAELQHRQVPRARSLLEKVLTAIEAANAVTPTDAPAPLTIGRTPTGQAELELSDPSRSDGPVTALTKPIGTKPAEQTRNELPSISLVEAYKLLKASPGSNWESIESARRQLVQRASPEIAPAEQRVRLQEEADRVNAAYRTIVAARAREP